MSKPSLSYYHTVEVALETSDVAPYATITAALAAITAAYTPAADKRFAVYIHPGTYAEALTLLNYVDLIGKGDRGDVVISQADGTVLSAGNITCNLKNIKVSQTDGVCLEITAAATGTISCEDCEFDSSADAITMANGTLNLENCVVADGDIELSNLACTLNMYYSRMVGATTGAINTAGNLVHTLKLVQCDLHGGGVNSAAAGAAATTTLDMRGCSNVGKLTNAGIGNFTVRDSDVQDCETTDLTVNAGHITIFGGDVGTCSGASADGDIVWWKHDNLIYVLPAMRFGHAVSAALAGDTIQLGQGSWAEGGLTIEVSINIIGEGLEESIISTGDDSDPILQIGTTDAAVVAVTLQGLTIQNTGTQEAIELISDTATTTVVARECFIDGGSASVALAAAGAGVKTFEAFECTFNAGTTCIDVDCTAAIADIDIHNCEFTAGAVANLTGVNHTFNAWDCEMGGGGIKVAAGVPPIVLIRCNDVGFLDSLTNTLAIEHCTVGDITTTTGSVNIEHSTVGILISGDATVDVNNSYVTEANPSDGTQTYYNCQIALIDSDGTSAIVVHGGDIQALDTPVSGTVVWWEGDHILKVMASGGNMKIDDALKATGLAAGDTIKLGQGTFAESNLTAVDGVDLVGEGQDISIISTGDNTDPIIDVLNGINITIRNIGIKNTGTANGIDIAAGAAAASVRLEYCSVENTGGSGNAVTLTTTGVGAPSLVAYDTYFNGTDNNIVVAGAVVANVDVYDCQFATGAVVTLTGADHTFDAVNCDCAGLAVTASANDPDISLTRCSDVGAITNRGGDLTMEHCTTGAITNATGTVNIEHCNTGSFTSSGAATVTISSSTLGAVEQGVALGTITITNCSMGAITTGAGGIIRLNGGCYFTDIAVNAGEITWQLDLTTWRVVNGTADMKIMDAADAATPGDTILIGPGSFDEALDLDDATHNLCTFKGFGRDKTIITQATGNTVLIDKITGATVEEGVIFEDLTIELSEATDGDAALKVDAITVAPSDASVILRNVTIATAWHDGTVYGILAIDDGTELATVEGYNCEISCTGGDNSYAVAANTCTSPGSVFRLYNTILNGETYDVYDDDILIELHQCEMNGAGVYVANSADAEVVAYNKEPFADVTPVTFAGAAGVFADLGGCELWGCLATVDLYEWVYVDAADNILEADADGADTFPSIGVVVWKPDGDTGLTAYVKKHGYLYNPNAPYTAGAVQYLDKTTPGASTETRPVDAVVQILGVAKNTGCVLVDVQLTDAGLADMIKWLSIPIAWGAGTAPTGTHVDGNSRRAVAIAVAGQTVFSQAVEIPENFLTFSKLYARLFPTVPTLTGMQAAHAYDDSVAGWTDETAAANNVAANDMNLFPAASGLNPEVNDAYYFGAVRRFSQIDINIGTQGVKAPGDWTLAWEYWNGSTWEALTGVTDGTVEFTAAAGVHTVSFTVPSDWATSTENGVLGYYIRARIATVSVAIGTRPLGTQSWTNDGTFDWTACSSAASADEDEATHSDTDTANNVPATEDLIIDLDISGAADVYTMVQKDTLSVELLIDALTNTTQILVLDFRLEYIASH